MKGYLFKREDREHPPKPVDAEGLKAAIKKVLPIGRGPWHIRELRHGKVVSDFGPWRTRGLAVRQMRARLIRATPGTVLQIESRRGKRMRVRAIRLPENRVRDRVETIALGLKGCPYVFGGSNPQQGIDCSGFTSWVVAAATDGAVILPHAARLQQDAASVDLIGFDRSAEWDLIFMWFPNSRGISWPSASHVGFKWRNGLMWDTRSPADPVSSSPIEPNNVTNAGRIEEVNGKR